MYQMPFSHHIQHDTDKDEFLSQNLCLEGHDGNAFTSYQPRRSYYIRAALSTEFSLFYFFILQLWSEAYREFFGKNSAYVLAHEPTYLIFLVTIFMTL